MIRAAAMTWDCGQQPDLDVLAAHIHDLSAGALRLHQVDTGGNEYAIVLATTPLTVTQAAEVFDQWLTGAATDTTFNSNWEELA